MGTQEAAHEDEADGGKGRRAYDSALRREQAARTRERIIEAATELATESVVGDWHSLTVRAVAERAGVSERTVYRHFVNERGLRDAVMMSLEEQSGVDLDRMKLSDVADTAERIYEQLAAFPLPPPPPLDETLDAAGQRMRGALLDAVSREATGWTEIQHAEVAAVLDVLWSLPAYEAMTRSWRLDQASALEGVTWVLGLIDEAVRQGRVPGDNRSPRRDG